MGGAYGYVGGNWKESLKVRESYGVSEGPAIVAVQLRRFSGEEGKAEMPGVVDIMSCISSVWRLKRCQWVIASEDRQSGGENFEQYGGVVTAW